MTAAGGNGPLESHSRANLARQRVGLIGDTPSEQVNMPFVGGDRVYGPQNALKQWRRIIAETEEHFEGHTP